VPATLVKHYAGCSPVANGPLIGNRPRWGLSDTWGQKLHRKDNLSKNPGEPRHRGPV